MRISDWSSDVCSSDLGVHPRTFAAPVGGEARMKVAMCDPSLFTGRYDDSLCAAMAGEGAEVALLGRPMRATDAIVPRGYRYEPRFFRRSEALRRRMGEGRAFRLLKAAEYGLSCVLGDLEIGRAPV